MNNIELCEVETVEIRGWTRVKRVTGHRFQDFAVHRWNATDMFDPWRITHLPTGLLVARNFETIEAAVDAMIEIARLRNDWAVLSSDDINPDLLRKIEKVVEANGGEVPQGPREFRAGLNGYSADVQG